MSDAGLGHLKTLGPDVALLDLSECRGVSGAAIADLASVLGMSASALATGSAGRAGDGGRCARDVRVRFGARILQRACRGGLARVPVRGEGGGDPGGGEIREEEIREESRRVAALAASERDEPDAVEDDGNILMFPIGAPLSHSHPNGGESPPHQYRRVSYLID